VTRRRRGSGEDQLIERAWRRVTLQTAALFATALLLLDGLALALVVQTAHSDTRQQAEQALGDADALTNPPPGVWVYKYDPSTGATVSSPGAPAESIDAGGLAAVAASGQSRDAAVQRLGREYFARTERRGGVAVQAVLDISEQETERHRVYLGLGVAGAVGLTVSVLVGAVIARRAIQPLGQALARQQRFVADASHELRTPLTQLHTRAQLIDLELRQGGDHTRLAADTRQLVRSTRHLADIVDDLLQAAQLRHAPQEFDVVDLGAIAAEATGAEAERAAERQIELRLSTQDGCLVRGAPTALRRALASLLDNALAHTPEGGHIVVELSRDEATVQCSVRDDGEGFDPAEAPRLFERFARGGHGDARRFGLGLALVSETMRAHGGTITAVGTPGRGAVFTLSLPAAPAE
jgi:signal transduction histidine kinase